MLLLVCKLDDAAARFALNSKRGPRNFYKGKGAKNLGRLTTKGKQREAGWASLQYRACCGWHIRIVSGMVEAKALLPCHA